MNEKKKWYVSKMIWINGIACVGILYQMFTGEELMNAEGQVAILAVINIFLRGITREQIIW